MMKPECIKNSKQDITLSCQQGNFSFLMNFPFFCTRPKASGWGPYPGRYTERGLIFVIVSVPFYNFPSLFKTLSTSKMWCATLKKQEAKTKQEMGAKSALICTVY